MGVHVFLLQDLAPIAALVLSFGITALGETVWGVLALANVRVHPEFPWSVVTMALLITLLPLSLLAFRYLTKIAAPLRHG